MSAAKSYKNTTGGFDFTLTRKKIKNINLRVRPDGTVAVSAPYGISEELILSFVEKNAFRVSDIIRALPPIAEKKRKSAPYPTEIEKAFLIKAISVCREIEPLFFTGKYIEPTIELCRGNTRWGYCQPRKRLIRLNIKLSEYPDECLRYVAIHEYCHLLVPNHSKQFYSELEKRLPNWRDIKKQLK